MTPAEFSEARQRLGLTLNQVASEFRVSSSRVAEWERGARAIPRKVADQVRWHAVVAAREAVLEASGLPPCSEISRLEERLEEPEASEMLAAIEALNRHGETCHVCRARADYVEQHGPPLPEVAEPLLLRAVGAVMRLADRLPGWLRPPKGEGGEGRRTGLLVAAAFSALAVVLFAVRAVARIVWISLDRPVASEPWYEPLMIVGAVSAGYVVGFYLAGAVFDATRRIRHRFIGYVLRGALATMAVYGTLGLVMPLLGAEFSYGEMPVIAGSLTVVGAIAGMVLWGWHRITGKSPESVT